MSEFSRVESLPGDHPLFSVVVPTRNRGHLLRSCLHSALCQTIDNYEVLVSDNSSSDNTAAVVREMRDPRIRYVRTPSDLSMPDSWEFALNHARGEFITYLCDDDAILPQLLESIEGVITSSNAEVISWASCVYYHSNWFEPRYRNELHVAPYEGETETRDARETIREIYASLRAYSHSPRMVHSMCRKTVIDRVRKRTGRLFHKTAPDYASAIGLLSQVDSHVYVDFPWHVLGTARESNRIESLAYDGGVSIKKFFAEFAGDDVFNTTDLQGHMAVNVVVDTLARMKQILTPELNYATIDRARYFQNYYDELRDLRGLGADVSEYERELRRVLGDEGWQSLVADAVPATNSRGGLRERVRSLARQATDRSDLLSSIEGQLRPAVFGRRSVFVGGIRIRGSAAGFRDIAECARFAGGSFRASFGALEQAWAGGAR